MHHISHTQGNKHLKVLLNVDKGPPGLGDAAADREDEWEVAAPPS